jgi:hypothetical protein
MSFGVTRKIKPNGLGEMVTSPFHEKANDFFEGKLGYICEFLTVRPRFLFL